MLIDRYFDQLFHNYRIPSRLVRYGIVYGGTARDALDGFEPRFDPAMKAQAEKMVEKLQAFIECCETYEAEHSESETQDNEGPRPKTKEKK